MMSSPRPRSVHKNRSMRDGGQSNHHPPAHANRAVGHDNVDAGLEAAEGCVTHSQGGQRDRVGDHRQAARSGGSMEVSEGHAARRGAVQHQPPAALDRQRVAAAS